MLLYCNTGQHQIKLPYYYDQTGEKAAAFKLDWAVSFDNGNIWSSAGDTKHTVYVTFDQPRESKVPVLR